MVGRSNVGKSTLINVLLGRKLAQTSGQPGKTRALHFYRWPEGKKIIVDLPGYGYAHASKTDRLRWEEFIGCYFQNDPHLERAMVLIDARHGPTKSDEEAIKFLSLKSIPVTVVIVKADTLKTQSQRALRHQEVKMALNSLGIGLEDFFWVSSHQGTGVKELKRDLQQRLVGMSRGAD